jgi:hypothetical protein
MYPSKPEIPNRGNYFCTISIALLLLLFSLFIPGQLGAYICGDINDDTNVNVGDLVYLANIIFKPPPQTPEPVNWDATDVNSDGLVNIGDVVFMANYVFHSGATPLCLLEMTHSQHSACKSFAKGTAEEYPPDQDCVEYAYDGQSVLNINHYNAGFNCCPDELLVSFKVQESNIIITEDELMITGGCDCLCLFDFSYTLTNLPPGCYTITVMGMYLRDGEPLEFEVDLTSGPASGQHCVTRDNYPWGI